MSVKCCDFDRKTIYSRFKKKSSLPRALTMLAWAVALALACWYELASQDGTYTPSIVMVSLTILAPGLISLGLDWLFMLYAVATLIVVSLPLGENTTLKNIWVPITYSISCIAGHWMKEKANVRASITYDVKNFKSYKQWLLYTIVGGIVVIFAYIFAWVGSNDDDLFWGIGVACVAVYTVLTSLDFWTISRKIDEEVYMSVSSGDYQFAQQQMKGFIDDDFDDGNSTSVKILKLSLAMVSTVFVGAMLERAKYSGWSLVALIAWIFAMFSIHRAKKYFEDYYVYKGN